LERNLPACFPVRRQPLRRDDNRDTALFGDPISACGGVDDGFLAPYRVHRIVTDVDAAGWRPTKGDKDRFGYEIPDDEYGTKDFERVIALRARTEAIAATCGFMRT
jgi:type I restriction enzyme R subunit